MDGNDHQQDQRNQGERKDRGLCEALRFARSLRCQTNVGHSSAPVVGFLTFHLKSSGIRQIFGVETRVGQSFARGVPAFLA